MSPLHPEALEAVTAIGRLDRRDFIRFAAIAGAAGAFGVPAFAKSVPTVPDGIRFMGPPEYAVFERLMAVALPNKGTSLVPHTEIPVLRTLDAALLGTMEPHILNGLKGGIAYFEQGPLETFGKPFSALDDERATGFCDGWADSSEVPRRALVVGLKKLIGLAYWANPPTWAPLGYDGPVSERWHLASLGNQPLPSA